ncbi:aldo/keto reductase [Kytococcus aerolatus]|uniref:aldo/keto reductase n=1 Tax=Kytococcus aerolatus TaxID=592308 RepID=UPI000B58942B|nr:aldo/keto reductase [Kytococcus aerolatus]
MTHAEVRDVRRADLLVGCMGLGGGWDAEPVTDEQVEQAGAVVEAALAAGLTWFDHADIYTRGKAEEAFGRALAERPGLRERIGLQSKCGILLPGEGGVMCSGETHGRYDSSPEHVRRSLEGSLARLRTDHLDVLLVHRPDPLTHPGELGRTLDALVAEGLVRQVGVSNHSPAQVDRLQAGMSEPLVVNQLETSLAARGWVESGVLVNTDEGARVGFPHGALEQALAGGPRVQGWGALAQGRYSGRASSATDPLEAAREEQTARRVAALAAEHGTTPESIVLAWLQRHPARVAPVVGTTSPQRIAACADAAAGRVHLSRAEWYELWVTARGGPLP